MGRKACHLSDDKSHAIWKLYMSGNNMRTISKMLAIPRKTISNIITTFKRTENTKKKPMSGGKEKLSLRYSGVVNRRLPSWSKKLPSRQKFDIIDHRNSSKKSIYLSTFTLPSMILIGTCPCQVIKL